MKKVIAALFACVAIASGAQASTIDLVGGSAGTLPGNWTDFNGALAPNVGDGITVYSGAQAASGEGVYINGHSLVTFEYLGTEAGNWNSTSTTSFANFFWNHATAVGTTYSEEASTGALDFSFYTNGAASGGVEGTFVNAVGSYGLSGLWLGVFQESATSAILMFGDGFGDADFDDMLVRVSVSAVPLPAALWLFGSALLGLGGLRARRVRRA